MKEGDSLSKIEGLAGIKAKFQAKLSTILQRELTVDSIDTYADDAVNDLIGFLGEVTLAYKQENPEAATDQKKLEDEALNWYQLQHIDQFLSVAAAKLQKIRYAEEFIAKNIEHIDEVITPPDKGGLIRGDYGGQFELPGVKNRLKTLLLILQENNVDLADVKVFEGDVEPSMMRQISYVTVLIPELERLVQVCDEERNASYVFDYEQLRALEVAVEDINRMSKDQKNSLLASHPGIGRRFIQSSKWIENLEEFLFEAIPKKAQVADEGKSVEVSDAVRVSTIELDPWKLFWIDEDGRHWGSKKAIQKKLASLGQPLSQKLIENMVAKANLKTRKILIGSRVETGYCFEDLIADPVAKSYLELPSVAEAGEWAGYWEEKESSFHYGPLSVIAEKIRLSENFLVAIVKDSVKTQKLKDRSGRITTGYAHENIVALPAIQEILKRPVTEKEGEWKNFWQDPETGYHFASTNYLGDKLGVNALTIERIAQSLGLVPKEIRAVHPKVSAYPYELLREDRKIIELTTLPKVEKSGEWKGFHIDSEGKHWGTVAVLTKKLHTVLIDEFVEKNKFESKKISTGRIICDSYCYEDFLLLPSIQALKNAKEVATEGDWKGFYIDETGEHWGPIKTLARKLNINEGRVARLVAERDLSSIPVRPKSGVKSLGVFSAYKFEDVQSLL